MSISFTPLRQNANRFERVLPDDDELSLSNANASDVLDALGIDESYSSSPWPIACFRSLLTVARRKRLNYRSPEIPTTEHSEPGRMTIVECGRPEGYVERRLKEISDLVNRALAAGATHVGWG